jgi:hypothetical protein
VTVVQDLWGAYRDAGGRAELIKSVSPAASMDGSTAAQSAELRARIRAFGASFGSPNTGCHSLNGFDACRYPRVQAVVAGPDKEQLRQKTHYLLMADCEDAYFIGRDHKSTQGDVSGVTVGND